MRHISTRRVRLVDIRKLVTTISNVVSDHETRISALEQT